MNQALSSAITLLGGPSPAATLCKVSRPAVDKWLKRGRLPRTDYTGETNYAERIAAACRAKDPRTPITREALLGLATVEALAPTAADVKAEVARLVALASRGEREFHLLHLPAEIRGDVESELVLELASRVREGLEPVASVPAWLTARVLEMAGVRPEKRAANA